MKYSSKGLKDNNNNKKRKQQQQQLNNNNNKAQEQNKKEGASSTGLCQTYTVTSPPREGEPAGTIISGYIVQRTSTAEIRLRTE